MDSERDNKGLTPPIKKPETDGGNDGQENEVIDDVEFDGEADD